MKYHELWVALEHAKTAATCHTILNFTTLASAADSAGLPCVELYAQYARAYLQTGDLAYLQRRDELSAALRRDLGLE